MARLLESMTVDIRKASDLHPHLWSEKVATYACATPDMLALGWHGQNKFDKGRKLFVAEHMTTVRDLRERCLRAGSEEEVLKVLRAQICVVWIHRDEDAELSRLGFKQNRENPKGGLRPCQDPTRSA